MRQLMVFARAFRSPLQATFSPCETDSLDELCQLLELADQRASEASRNAGEN